MEIFLVHNFIFRQIHCNTLKEQEKIGWMKTYILTQGKILILKIRSLSIKTEKGKSKRKAHTHVLKDIALSIKRLFLSVSCTYCVYIYDSVQSYWCVVQFVVSAVYVVSKWYNVPWFMKIISPIARVRSEKINTWLLVNVNIKNNFACLSRYVLHKPIGYDQFYLKCVITKQAIICDVSTKLLTNLLSNPAKD